jgi:hypothetical protein
MPEFKKVIIAGSRDFCSEEHYKLLEAQMDQLVLSFGLPDEIVSGGARGADKLGERYASENGIGINRFVPDWDGLGKRAGFVRNQDMGNYADTLVAFWDGHSKGTRHMIEFAHKRGLDVILIITKNNNNGSGALPVS